MFGEHRNMRDYAASLLRLEKRAGDFDEIWPSHGEIPVPVETIGKLQKAAEEVLSGKRTGKLTPFRDREILVYDLGFSAFLCDPLQKPETENGEEGK